VSSQRSEIKLTPSHLKIPKLAPAKPDVEAVSVSESSDDECEDTVTLAQYLKSVVVMPKALRILCLTNLLCWMGYLSYCLYFTDFVAEAVFHGDPSVSNSFCM
jgi:solute carrier family 45, member 1/2/4